MKSELLSGTRVFGKLAPQDYGGAVLPFISEAQKFGDVLVVSQTTYQHLPALQEFVSEIGSVRT